MRLLSCRGQRVSCATSALLAESAGCLLQPFAWLQRVGGGEDGCAIRSGKVASPAETSLAIIATAPRNYGGFGMRGARLNEPVKLRREAERIAHGSSLVCDVLWPERGVALEYDSSQFHGSSLRLSRDSRRRSALAAQGLEIRSITASQLENVFEFQETILHAFRAAGCDFKRLNGKQLDRHMRLRSELRKCV